MLHVTGPVLLYQDDRPEDKRKGKGKHSVLSAFAGCLGHERCNLLFQSFTATVGTFDFSILVLTQRQDHGEKLLAFFAEVIVVRHGVPSSIAPLQAEPSSWLAKSTKGSSPPPSLKNVFFM